jgi:hypothetical protein
VSHSDEAILSLGDVDRLVERLREAFRRHGATDPDSGLPIWYLETGTRRDRRRQAEHSTTGSRNWPGSSGAGRRPAAAAGAAGRTTAPRSEPGDPARRQGRADGCTASHTSPRSSSF